MTQAEVAKYFAFEHLPPHLQDTSKPFADLAWIIVGTIPDNRMRGQALTKLLEAKDAAVRASL